MGYRVVGAVQLQLLRIQTSLTNLDLRELLLVQSVSELVKRSTWASQATGATVGTPFINLIFYGTLCLLRDALTVVVGEVCALGIPSSRMQSLLKFFEECAGRIKLLDQSCWCTEIFLLGRLRFIKSRLRGHIATMALFCQEEG